MKVISSKPGALLLAGMLAVPAATSVSAQQQELPAADVSATVYGERPVDESQLEKGPNIEGIISARDGDRIQITDEKGTSTVIGFTQNTEILGKGGFLGLATKERANDSLLNGLPVKVETLQAPGGLLASQIKFKNDDFKTAAMIRNGTAPSARPLPRQAPYMTSTSPLPARSRESATSPNRSRPRRSAKSSGAAIAVSRAVPSSTSALICCCQAAGSAAVTARTPAMSQPTSGRCQPAQAPSEAAASEVGTNQSAVHQIGNMRVRATYVAPAAASAIAATIAAAASP